MKLWSLGLLLIFGSSVTGLKLWNICENDHFDFNGIRVNSVYLSDHKIQLETAGYFLVGLYEPCLDNSFYQETQIDWWHPKELLKVKDD